MMTKASRMSSSFVRRVSQECFTTPDRGSGFLVQDMLEGSRAVNMISEILTTDTL